MRVECRGQGRSAGQLTTGNGSGESDIREHLSGSSAHEHSQIGDGGCVDLPHVAAVGQSDVRTGYASRTAGTDANVEPIRLTQECGTRNRSEIACGKQRLEVHGMAVHVQLRESGKNTRGLVFLTLERLDELHVVQARIESGSRHRHQRHRVGCKLDKSGVAVGNCTAYRIGEVHAVAKTLDPVRLLMDRLVTGTVESVLVDGRVDAELQRCRLDTGQLRGKLAEQRIDL